MVDIVNGQKNTVKITFDNKGESNYTIDVIGGALVNKDNPSEIYRNVRNYFEFKLSFFILQL